MELRALDGIEEMILPDSSGTPLFPSVWWVFRSIARYITLGLTPSPVLPLQAQALALDAEAALGAEWGWKESEEERDAQGKLGTRGQKNLSVSPISKKVSMVLL